MEDVSTVASSSRHVHLVHSGVSQNEPMRRVTVEAGQMTETNHITLNQYNILYHIVS